MSTRLIHILDERTPEDAVRLCSLLLRRLPCGEVTQLVMVMGQRPAGLVVPEGLQVVQIGHPLHFGRILSTARLGHKIAEWRADAVFAYSGMTAAAADGVDGEVPVVAIVADAGEAEDSSRWILSGQGGPLDTVCLSGTVQRRLVEHGIPMATTAVIRPGVDFAEIRRARECADRLRKELSAPGRILVTQSPPSRGGGQYYAVWAMAILHHIWPDAVLVVPGCSREQERIGRLMRSIVCPQAYRLTGDRYLPAELMAVADALLMPALDDSPTGWMAWAMAAGVPMIGSAVPCVTEFIADRQNGFLCKPGEPHTLAIRIRTVLESVDDVSRCVQAGRHQAYDIFRAELCVDEFLKIIRNLRAKKPALAQA